MSKAEEKPDPEEEAVLSIPPSETNMDVSEELRLPFDSDKIKKNYQKFDYVPPEHVIDRLNNVLGLAWSFDIMDITLHRGDHIDEVICVGKMSIAGKNPKTAIGTDTVQWVNNNDKPMVDALGKAYKCAASNSMKLCARLYGVANQLWGGDAIPESLSNSPDEPNITPNQRLKETLKPKKEPPSQADIDLFTDLYGQFGDQLSEEVKTKLDANIAKGFFGEDKPEGMSKSYVTGTAGQFIKKFQQAG